MEKHKFSFIALRDYLKVNNPEVVFDFDKTISKMVEGDNNTLDHKGSFIETINDYLAKIVNNERLFYIVQSWKYKVWHKFRIITANREYVPPVA